MLSAAGKRTPAGMKKREQKPKSEKPKLKIPEIDRGKFARDLASPELLATLTVSHPSDATFNPLIDFHCLREEITKACDAVNAGDMRLPERIAFAQAHTLNHLFNRLAQRALDNLGRPMFEPFMRLALRAQAQSARTLETLATLKSPTVFAKQLNVANQQVVSNGNAVPAQVHDASAALNEPVPIVPFAETKFPAPAHERMDR